MSAERVFIDWTQPLLPAVVRHLVGNQASPFDFSGAIVVVPGRRAGRRFRELLSDHTQGRHSPPRVITISELPELLYVPKKPFASELVQRLAWIDAIRSVPKRDLQSVVRALPERADLEGWFSLAELLWQQHRELAADGLSFADVLRRGSEVESFREHARWRALDAIQRRYLALLDERGLWDRQTARRVALQQREFQTDARIFLVGMTDLTRVQRGMLEQVADRVTAFVHAPASLAEAFDPMGCIVPEAWRDMPIQISEDQLLVADGPLEEAECVAAALAGFREFRPDEITVGLADESLVPAVQRQLQECGVPTRWSVGVPAARTPPVRLLVAIADFLEDGRAGPFAALVRHPDIGNWLTMQRMPSGWLTDLDCFIQRSVPNELGEWARRERHALWSRAYERLEKLIKPLRGRARPLNEWPARILDVLRNVYARVEFAPDDPETQVTISGLEELQAALREQSETPVELAPRTTAAQAIRLLLRALAGESVPPPAPDSTVELMGWLDVATDDAPATVVVGLNEGLIPQSLNVDPFLPDRMRTALGVTNNDRRYARDAHAVLSVLHSRRKLVLVAGRRDARGDPLAPSRLLLASAPEEVANRVRLFYRPRAARCIQLVRETAPRERTGFFVPRPRPPSQPVTVLRVTAFRDYLASPYRFYLRHVEGLSDLDDSVDELSAAAFGNLVHAALKRFGESDVRESTDAQEIAEFLSVALNEAAAEEYGPKPIMAVEVQLEQARARLRAFAEWQAEWACSGWRIQFVEQPGDDTHVPLALPDGRQVQLAGRIDRIDRFRNENRWAILDYKTGEATASPEKTHRHDGEWIDLQLPLYRHLARGLGVQGDIQLGYVRLLRDTNDVKADLADWTAEDLHSADETALTVARQILDGEFWEELVEPPAILQEFGPVCQDGVFDREVVV